MKNFHWGHGIFTFYVIFVIAILSVLYASTQVDRELVIDDYYSLDLDYQNRFDQINNGNNDQKTDIEYDAVSQKIIVQFKDLAEGMVHMYRPSDNSMDFEQEIVDGESTVDTKNLAKGLWVIKLHYSADEKKYYKESKIYL